MRETIQSVGIDIGTSTTQLIFSRLTIENLASSYTVPRISIVDREVIYRSEVHVTPLCSSTEIDAEAVGQIVREEYRKAGVTPDMLQTGAVIITGETARKENASRVLEMLSDMAGDFVVATAGPGLESVLAGKGAGADRISEEHHCCVANVDIGGGTSNIAVFENGELKDTACLDIGGRLVRVENGKIHYIFPKIARLAAERGIAVREGDPADAEKLRALCMQMAEELAAALGLTESSKETEWLYTNDGRPLGESRTRIDGLTFSGGVADCMGTRQEEDAFRYGDIGVLLGQAIAQCPALAKVRQFQSAETIRATVVGAGSHTTTVSGSTIFYARECLPMKNIPVLRVDAEGETDADVLAESIERKLPLFFAEGKPEQTAIAFDGAHYIGFEGVQELAAAIVRGAGTLLETHLPLLLVMEQDIGNALGNALNLALGRERDILCIDGVCARGGDYIDIGEPLAGGRVVPVVIKTLVFNQSQ